MDVDLRLAQQLAEEDRQLEQRRHHQEKMDSQMARTIYAQQALPNDPGKKRKVWEISDSEDNAIVSVCNEGSKQDGGDGDDDKIELDHPFFEQDTHVPYSIVHGLRIRTPSPKVRVNINDVDDECVFVLSKTVEESDAALALVLATNERLDIDEHLAKQIAAQQHIDAQNSSEKESQQVLAANSNASLGHIPKSSSANNDVEDILHRTDGVMVQLRECYCRVQPTKRFSEVQVRLGTMQVG